MPLFSPATIDVNSDDPSPQQFSVWLDAVGEDINVLLYYGQPARFFSCAVGGVLQVKGEVGNFRALPVVAGVTYMGKLTAIQASGSTAYGVSIWE